MKSLKILILLLLANSIFGQIQIEQNKVVPKTNPTVTPNGSFLKVSSDLDCELFIDGEKKGTLAAGEEYIKKIALGPGEYKIVAKSLDGLDKVSQLFVMEKTDKFLFIELKSFQDNRLAEERKREEDLMAEKALKAEEIRLTEEIRIAKENALIDIEESMVSVSGGSFTMGCNFPQDADCGSSESPSHQVTLSSYKIGKYEVTQAQWEAVMGHNPSEQKGCPSCPVENVSWTDVGFFISELNKKSGKTYRLPTEAQWEYAAQGGGKSQKYMYSGGNNLYSVGWFEENSGNKKYPVGQKSPNELGLYDMAGNVREWCSDVDRGYTNSSQTNPQSAGGLEYKISRSGIIHSSNAYKPIRGGSYATPEKHSLVKFRNSRFNEDREDHLGFRLALDN
jgi:formylglycine-generating enzyme required for sulfatase activity